MVSLIHVPSQRLQHCYLCSNNIQMKIMLPPYSKNSLMSVTKIPVIITEHTDKSTSLKFFLN